MRVLLDTCAVSEAKKAGGNPRVREQIRAIQAEDLFLSVVTMGELFKGISLLAAGRRKDALSNWYLNLEQDYADRILAIDTEVARIWGELTAAAQQRGHTISVSDGLIAATACRHGLHVMTRNTRDFKAIGALLVDPWAEA